MRPLYDSAQQTVLGPAGHRGLWFDKFCDRWRRDGNQLSMKTPPGGSTSPKQEWLDAVLRENPRVGDAEQLEATTQRLARLVTNANGRLEVFRTDDRFVTGLGRAHPIENGFAWHPTLGTPYLPGSSIKGLVRSWAQTEANTEADSERIVRLLGAGQPEGRAGAICFLDALPIGPVRLEVDVLTPHYAGWTDQLPPGDWRSPIPVPFLVTAAKQRFMFAVVPRRGPAPVDVECVLGWLREALAWEGAGAKTAVGYGRFDIDAEAGARIRDTELQQRARKLSTSSREGYWRLQVEQWSEKDLLDQIRLNIEKDELSDPTERSAFVTAVRELREEWLGRWRKQQSHGPPPGVGGRKLKARAKLIDGEP